MRIKKIAAEPMPVRLLKSVNAVAVITVFLMGADARICDAQSVSYFSMHGIGWGIAAGPDGNLWFTTTTGIGKMMPSGDVTIYPTPARPTIGRSMIAVGPDGRMWYTRGDVIGAITMDGSVTEYPLPPHVRAAIGITGSSDGRIWFGYLGGIGAMTVSGELTIFPVPGLPEAQVIDLVEGPDGSIWFIEYPRNSIGRITPAGVISHFATNPPVCCLPNSIARSSDGGFWLSFDQEVAHLSMDGTISPLRAEGYRIVTVERGSGGGLWFGTFGAGVRTMIGKISETGEIRTISLPADVPMVRGMAAGPDGALWATLYPPSQSCVLGCTPPDLPPPLAIVRVDFEAPSNLASIPTLSVPFLMILGLVFGALALVMLPHKAA